LSYGLHTDYSASDTTAYYLIGILRYWHLTKDESWLTNQRDSIQSAIDYVMRHIDDDGIWWEDPRHAGGARSYALKVTYWKDSSAWDRPDGRPEYPVAFSITQAAYFAALRGLSQLQLFGGDDEQSKLVQTSNKYSTFITVHDCLVSVKAERSHFI
jgi:glycogen debranching enzyme